MRLSPNADNSIDQMAPEAEASHAEKQLINGNLIIRLGKRSFTAAGTEL